MACTGKDNCRTSGPSTAVTHLHGQSATTGTKIFWRFGSLFCFGEWICFRETEKIGGGNWRCLVRLSICRLALVLSRSLHTQQISQVKEFKHHVYMLFFNQKSNRDFSKQTTNLCVYDSEKEASSTPTSCSVKK